MREGRPCTNSECAANLIERDTEISHLLKCLNSGFEVRTELNAEINEKIKERDAFKSALSNLCETLQKTTVYTGVRYGKTALAKAINDARRLLEKQ